MTRIPGKLTKHLIIIFNKNRRKLDFKEKVVLLDQNKKK